MRNQSADEIYIYVLLLENGKYYVGQSNDIQRRLRNHFSSSKSVPWTRLHKPIRIYKKYRTGTNNPIMALKQENAQTLECIITYGWRNVRGGDFTQVNDNEHLLGLILNSNLGNHVCPIRVADDIDVNAYDKCVFTLRLEEDMYFVGTTRHLNLAILNELNGRGSEWTKRFKPVELIRAVSVNNDQEFERVHFRELKTVFLEQNYAKVRGGVFKLIHPESHRRMVYNAMQLQIT